MAWMPIGCEDHFSTSRESLTFLKDKRLALRPLTLGIPRHHLEISRSTSLELWRSLRELSILNALLLDLKLRKAEDG